MLLVSMDNFALSAHTSAMLCLNSGQRQVNQIAVFVDPDMQDGLQFHFMRFGVVSQHLLASVQLTDGLLAGRRHDGSAGREATEIPQQTLPIVEQCFPKVGDGFLSTMLQQILPGFEGQITSFESQIADTNQFANTKEHGNIRSSVESQVQSAPDFVADAGVAIEEGSQIVTHRRDAEKEIGGFELQGADGVAELNRALKHLCC